MDKKQLQQFKKRLEKRQQELHRSLTRAQEDGRELEDDRAADESDRAASSDKRLAEYVGKNRTPHPQPKPDTASDQPIFADGIALGVDSCELASA